MKIMHIIWSLNVGGAESMLVDIINEQVKTEKVFLLIINSEIKSELIENISHEVEIITINGIPGSRNIWHIFKINYHIYRVSPDIIHSIQKWKDNHKTLVASCFENVEFSEPLNLEILKRS